MPSRAYKKFIASMEMNYEKWHDGIGYDLDALKQMAREELKSVETLLRGGTDWRDVEALAAIGSSGAMDALRESLKASDPQTRLSAAGALHDKGELADLDKLIADELRAAPDIPDASYVLDLARQHDSPRVREALLWCAKHHDSIGPHCAAMLFFFAGIANESFDWNHRPFFLRFLKHDPKGRADAFIELCEKLRIDPNAIS